MLELISTAGSSFQICGIVFFRAASVMWRTGLAVPYAAQGLSPLFTPPPVSDLDESAAKRPRGATRLAASLGKGTSIPASSGWRAAEQKERAHSAPRLRPDAELGLLFCHEAQ
ncbi:hypothetical protein AAFF_G00047550 [Aldrovandia affinis]|uniref:Uncharacterized protein n=1 Tax=Aldrovandia affinis TaxID=143900 RepID=A0AAD7WEZ5_9TELE|nr:hypothetical protein AAFF_G00047550 [Aldrovandia affinis]